MFANQFSVFCEEDALPIVFIPKNQGMTTLEFPSYSGVVGHLVGKNWTRIDELRREFQSAFPGFDLSVKYDENTFTVHLPAIPEAVAFVNASFGVEVALANEPIKTDSGFIGAVIGKGGSGLRTIEDGAPTKCTIYYEDDAFYVRFAHYVSTEARVRCMSYVKMKIYGRAGWLEARLDDYSEVASTVSTTAVSEMSELSDLFSEMSPTPSEACSL